MAMKLTSKNNSITIITEEFKRLDSLYALKLFFKNLFKKKKYTGHYAVTRSLCEGLKELNINFNYNPRFPYQIKKQVIVLSNVNALRQCIKLKEKGVIKKLLAGPNIVVRSNEYNQLLGDDKIDTVIVPSEWVKQAYIEDLPVIKDRISVWAAGINPLFYNNTNQIKSKRILIYWKALDEKYIADLSEMIHQAGFESYCLKYGTYTMDSFKNELSNASAVVYLSFSESQGLALQEIWSMDIPTFVWQPEQLIISEKSYNNFSSAPYLTAETGLFFYNLKELEAILINLKNHQYNFKPRKIVMERYTDAICANNLLNIDN